MLLFVNFFLVNMKKQSLFIVAMSLLCSMSMAAKKKTITPKTPWEQADSIVNVINKTDFEGRPVYRITDFGARAMVDGRQSKLAHDAINLAIITCSQNGGGTVVIPDSTYLCGPIDMQSNVNLHFEDGAELKFATDVNLYYPAVLTRWEGVDCYNAHPLIYAYGCENIALTGKGRLDAQAGNDNWWSMNGNPRYGWRDGKVGQNMGARDQLLRWNEAGTPIYSRVFGPEDGMRPQFVNFYHCNTILIEDVTLLRSPFWVLHPLFCNDVVVRGVTVINDGPNGDGCDPECCNRVLIEDCVFDTGDDCIAIKSGRNQDGRKFDTPSQNIVVRRCQMKDGHGGVVIGSEISGGYRNLYVEDCVMDSPNLERVIRIKTSSCRGGVIENVFVRNVKVGRCKEAVLRINLDYEPREMCTRGFNPIVRNVNMENVTCQESQFGVVLIGMNDEYNIYDISLKNCEFNGVTGTKQIQDIYRLEGLYKNISLVNVNINGAPARPIEDSK